MLLCGFSLGRRTAFISTGQPHRSQRSCSAESRAPHSVQISIYFEAPLLTRSLKSFEGLKIGTFLASIRSDSPVAGLRTFRAGRSWIRNEPNPRSSMDSPRAKASSMVSQNPTNTALVSSLVKPVLSEIASISFALVTIKCALLTNAKTFIVFGMV